MRHFASYCIFVVFFFILNMITSPSTWWWYWPALGWGLGVALHYVNSFGLPGTEKMVEKWEIEETVREMKKYREAQNRALPPGTEVDSLELPNLKKGKQKLYDEEDYV